MMSQRKRACNKCGYPVTHCIISDAHDTRDTEQFVAIMRKGTLAGLAATVENCPRCGIILSVRSTFAVNH